MIEGNFNEVKDQLLEKCKVKHPFYAIPSTDNVDIILNYAFETHASLFNMTKKDIIGQLRKIDIGEGVIKYCILQLILPDVEGETTQIKLRKENVEVKILEGDIFLDSISEVL